MTKVKAPDYAKNEPPLQGRGRTRWPQCRPVRFRIDEGRGNPNRSWAEAWRRSRRGRGQYKQETGNAYHSFDDSVGCAAGCPGG